MKEIIKIGEEIKQRLKMTDKINKTNSCVFEKVNKMDKPLAKLTMKKSDKQNDLLAEAGQLFMKTISSSSWALGEIAFPSLSCD